MNTPHFVYPFICWWTVSCLQFYLIWITLLRILCTSSHIDVCFIPFNEEPFHFLDGIQVFFILISNCTSWCYCCLYFGVLRNHSLNQGPNDLCFFCFLLRVLYFSLWYLGIWLICGKVVRPPISKQESWVCSCPWHPSDSRSLRRIPVQPAWAKKQNPISKTARTKKKAVCVDRSRVPA
jgi:hypothetical protein